MRRSRIACASLFSFVGIVAIAFGSPAAAQPTASETVTANDAAVLAIQRARALAEQTTREPHKSDQSAKPSVATPTAEANASLDPAPRPLGEPSFNTSPIDSVSAVDGDTGWVLSTLSALGVVIGLVFAARWCLTRMQQGGDPVARSAAVEVLTRVPIGNRQRVMLLRIGGRVVVVGDAGGSLTTLAELDDEQEVADLLQSVSASRSTSTATGFRDLYRQMAGLGTVRTDDADTALDGRPEPIDAYGDRSQDEVRRLLSRVRGAAASFAGGTQGVAR